MSVVIMRAEHDWRSHRAADFLDGAKHSTPGQGGRPDWSRGVPPPSVPVTMLTSDISVRSSPNEEISTLLVIIFDKLPYGMLNVSVRQAQHQTRRLILVKSCQNGEKSMFIRSIQEHSGDV